MPLYSGGGGGFRSLRRYRGRRRGSYRARRFKRVSRQMVASALETKYHPDPQYRPGTYRFGINTTGNLCEDNSTGNVGAAYFCPMAFEDTSGTLRTFSAGDGRLSNVIGTKIWLKSVRMNCMVMNNNAAALNIRCTVFQFHDWAACNPASTGDTHFSKALVPFGVSFGAAPTIESSDPFGLYPSLKAAGKFTILYDVAFVLDPVGATANSQKMLSIRITRGIKRLIEFDPSGFTVMRNPIIACFYASVDNDISAATNAEVTIESRVAYKDI